jgi:O-antigen/teichoic acid export membrane protein
VAFINGHYRYGLIAAGHQNIEMLVSALGAIVALVLIPFLYFRWGITGAALALVITETVIWLGSWFYSIRLLDLKGHARLLLRPLLALALASSVWWLGFDSAKVRVVLSLLMLLVLALVFDRIVRERVRELLALRQGWSERRATEELPKAHGGINA